MALCKYTEEDSIKKDPDDHFDCPQMRIVLLGKTGVGKSAVGNTILGRKHFESVLSNVSVTSACQKKHALVDNRYVAVVDTPGLFDTEKPNDEIQREVVKSIQLSCPGPHAFLLVMQLNRFTNEEKQYVEALQEIFGEEANKHMIILFTRGDDLQGQTVHNFVRNAHPDLREVIKKCGNRYHVFNNRNMFNRAQVTELFHIIDCMMTMNADSHYTQEMYEEAEAKIKKKKEELMMKMNFNKQMQFWKRREAQIRKMAEYSDLRCGFEEPLKDKVHCAYRLARKGSQVTKIRK